MHSVRACVLFCADEMPTEDILYIPRLYLKTRSYMVQGALTASQVMCLFVL